MGTTSTLFLLCAGSAPGNPGSIQKSEAIGLVKSVPVALFTLIQSGGIFVNVTTQQRWPLDYKDLPHCAGFGFASQQDQDDHNILRIVMMMTGS